MLTSERQDVEAHPRGLMQLFRPDLRLVVPLFQRPYVWDQEQQWQPLWEDVVATMDRVAHDNTAPHFMGAIVLEQKRGRLGSIEVREVVDGQQRLTTLQLLIAAVRDAYLTRGFDSRHSKRLLRLLENDPELAEHIDERYRLWPTNKDRDPYRDVMQGKYRDAAASDHLPRIAQAYVFFRDELDTHLGENSDDTAARGLDALSEVLFEYLEVVVIDLGEQDNAQVIFETLNARGTELRASDLIKNMLFRLLAEHGRPVEELYARYWEPLEHERWQAPFTQGRRTWPRLDAFMGYFLALLLQREVQTHQLFTAARAYVGRSPERAEEFLQEAARYARLYDDMESGRLPDRHEVALLRRMSIVDTQTVTPLLLWLLGNTTGPGRRVALLALESYLVRRTLCRLTAKNYNRVFLELLRRLGSGETPVGDVVTNYLAGQRSDSGMWPTDDELKRSFATLPLYRLLKRERLQQLLEAMEVYATSGMTEEVRRGKLSVEHLLPQKWEENWPLPAAPEDAAAVTEQRAQLLHTIGNLTLVTGSLNSSMSNESWSTKRRRILETSALTLNRRLPEVWDEQAIEARGAVLAGLASELWLRPQPGRDDPLLADDRERDLRPDRDATARSAATAAEPGESRRRDVGKHIVHVFAAVPVGTFLTVAEIRRRPSPEYSDAPPSAGAISARLFPASGRTTVPGVDPGLSGGVRGATKSASS